MKKSVRSIAIVLAFLMLASMAFFTVANAEGEPYFVSPRLFLDGKLYLDVYLDSVEASVGNIALSTNDLFVPKGTTLATAVTAAPDVTVTKVGNEADSTYVSDTRVAFSWYPAAKNGAVAAIDATDEKKLLATVNLEASAMQIDAETVERLSENFAFLAEDVSDIASFKDGESASVLLSSSNTDFANGAVFEKLPKLSNVTATKGNGYANIRWTKPTFPCQAIGILCVELNQYSWTDDATATSYKWEGLTNGTAYTFYAFPVINATGASAAETQIGFPSKELKVTPSRSSSGSVIIAGGTAQQVVFEAGEGKFVNDSEKETVKVDSGDKLSSISIPEVIPPEGMKFMGWTEDGETLINPSTYKVTSGVTLKPVFEKIETADADYHLAYLNGYDDSTVKPENPITRAEAAAIIARVSTDFKENDEYKTEFKDVTDEDWFVTYVGYCFGKGIINGYPNGEFKPNQNITRAEFVTMITRMTGMEITKGNSFPDVAETHWASDFINTLKVAGYINGYTDGKFLPDQFIVRCEAVKIVNHAVGRVPSIERIDTYVKDEGNPFTDLKNDFWGFYDMLEAAVPHKVADYHA